MALKNKFTQKSAVLSLWALPFLVLAVIPHETQLLEQKVEVVQACVMGRERQLDPLLRSQIASCLGWETYESPKVCYGFYKALPITPIAQKNLITIEAKQSSLSASGRSVLRGQVRVAESNRMLYADTAYIYRDAHSQKITRIDLIDNVYLMEPDKLIIAKRVRLNPQDKSGYIESILYRLAVNRKGAMLPAWGRAKAGIRLPNQTEILQQGTYTTCPPNTNWWQLEARELIIYPKESKGVAKDAKLRFLDLPVLYTPYLSFPIEKKRKTGFLLPMAGYSNITGFDFLQPFYWNIAPNYDATLTSHYYSERGVMWGGDFRFLTPNSAGVLGGKFLPNDVAYQHFLTDNGIVFPSLLGRMDDRWSLIFRNDTNFSDRLHLNVDFQEVSDPYYLQDFNTNVSISTINQILRQGTLTYQTDHWLLSGMLQSYQTMHPINQSEILDIYERLPQLMANGSYRLPYHAQFDVLSELDVFHWPGLIPQPQGPRYHLNPVLTFLWETPWGYLRPRGEFIENFYNLTRYPINEFDFTQQSFNRLIPRYNLDSGLIFERSIGSIYSQTLEPRLFYFYVPYQNQSEIPVFDSAYMIFNYDQLFRYNRFSGFDRIGDTNQLSYALTSRFLSNQTGFERASVSIGQTRYFSKREVMLCYNPTGYCMDPVTTLGFLSPNTTYSPIATRATYQVNRALNLMGGYVFNSSPQSPYSAELNLHYMPEINHILNFNYTYLAYGNVTRMVKSGAQPAALHQATTSITWPVLENWSLFGIYSYNISKQYDMMSFAGLQFDNCCWAFRIFGGRTFMSLNPFDQSPQYNSNFYLQLLLKGLGSVARNDPSSTIQTYLPGYKDIFH